jgi:uncharacterized repeat protein (TIGR01451 family)
MKKTMLLTAVLIAFSMMSNAQPKNIELRYSGYILIAQTQRTTEAGVVPFVSSKHDSLPKEKAHYRFGLLYSDANATVLELLNAESNTSIKKITVEEFFGKEGANWKPLPQESKTTAASNVAAFQVQSGGNSLKVIREISVTKNEHLPLGKGLVIKISLIAEKPLKIKTNFFGQARGTLSANGSTITIASNDTTLSLNPMIVFSYTPKTVIEVFTEQNLSKSFTATNDTVNVASATTTEIFSLTACGTTVQFSDYISRQAENLQSYFATRKSIPDMISATTANKTSTSPGDTVEYTIYSHNIGTGAATDISVNNIIPRGTVYLEGSATNDESSISLSREEAQLPKQGRVTNITWKFTSPFTPGEEKSVRFKVIVQ